MHRRLVRTVWSHGLARVGLVTAAWVLFSFLVDWGLHVPGGVRAFHFAVLLALPAYVAWRELVLRLRRVPDTDGLAVLVERAHPELHELLVSAVQLARRPAADGADPALVARVVEEAERRAGELDLAGVLEPGPTRRALGQAGAALAVLAFALLVHTPTSAIFLARLAGGGPPWPLRTRLLVEVPVAGGRAQVEELEDELRVRVARGSDVPVVVRAEGVVPDDVTIRFDGGQQWSVPAAGDATFRTLLRSLQEDVAFHVTGGDDRDERPRVTIEVLQPPDVRGIAVAIEPPAYTGLPPRLEFDRDVQVLAGSRLTVHVQPDPPEARGLARLLPEDRELELRPRAFPARPEAPEDSAPIAGLAFELVADGDLRYRFELQDDTGLSNPDPGLFAVRVVKDAPPEVDLLSPGRADVETVVGGWIALRARAADDFGLEQLELSVAPTGAEGEERVWPLDWRPIAAEERPGAPARAAGYAARRLSTDELAGGSPPVEGELFTLVVAARDGRVPEPQVGRSAPVRVRVVSGDEFLRRIQDRLARARTDVGALAELAQDKRQRTQELIASLESDDLRATLDASEVGAALTGQRRVQGDARALARELASVAESLLYSGLDERAGGLLEELDRRLAEITDRGFHPEPWVELARLEREGALGQALFASKLVEVVGLALALSEEDAAGATDALRRAQEAGDLAVAHEALLDAADLQTAAIAKTDRLLELLAEWDNFQSVLALTRDILNRQKNLLERTRQYAKEN